MLALATMSMVLIISSPNITSPLWLDCMPSWPMAHTLLHHGPYTIVTYSCGTKGLNYIFITPDLVPSIQQCDILPFDSIFTSDHSACYVDIDPTISLGSNVASSWSPAAHWLHSCNTVLHNEYVSCLHTMLSNQDVFARAAQLDLCSQQFSDSNESLLPTVF